MDKFLLAENPLKKPNSNEYDRLYIIHTIEPKCIIEAIYQSDLKVKIKSDYPQKPYFHINSNEKPESWLLVIRDVYSPASTDSLEELLPRAWRWYRSYLEWEDTNIDIQEDGKWN